MDQSQQDFAARLARLGVEKPAQALAAGDNIVAPVETPRPKFETSDDSLKGRLAYPASVVWSFIFGMLSVFLARLIMAHMVGIPEGDEPMSQYLIDIAIAGALVFTIKIAMGTADKTRSTASTIGLILAITTMHNIFWIFPDAMSVLYGQEWVEALLSRSEPSSLYFKGQYIPIE